MNEADSVCIEKTCLSHMCDTSVCNYHMLSNLDIHNVSRFDS